MSKDKKNWKHDDEKRIRQTAVLLLSFGDFVLWDEELGRFSRGRVSPVIVSMNDNSE